MRVLRNLLVAAILVGGVAVSAASPASASTPCNTAPNYCHIDADGVLVAQTGSRVGGTQFWDNGSTSHFSVTLRDELPANGRAAYLQVRYRTGGVWYVYGTYYTHSSWTVSRTISWPGHYIDAVEFRTAQHGAQYVGDLNSYLGA